MTYVHMRAGRDEKTSRSKRLRSLRCVTTKVKSNAFVSSAAHVFASAMRSAPSIACITVQLNFGPRGAEAIRWRCPRRRQRSFPPRIERDGIQLFTADNHASLRSVTENF